MVHPPSRIVFHPTDKKLPCLYPLTLPPRRSYEFYGVIKYENYYEGLSVRKYTKIVLKENGSVRIKYDPVG